MEAYPWCLLPSTVVGTWYCSFARHTTIFQWFSEKLKLSAGRVESNSSKGEQTYILVVISMLFQLHQKTHLLTNMDFSSYWIPKKEKPNKKWAVAEIKWETIQKCAWLLSTHRTHTSRKFEICIHLVNQPEMQTHCTHYHSYISSF